MRLEAHKGSRMEEGAVATPLYVFLGRLFLPRQELAV